MTSAFEIQNPNNVTNCKCHEIKTAVIIKNNRIILLNLLFIVSALESEFSEYLFFLLSSNTKSYVGLYLTIIF